MDFTDGEQGHHDESDDYAHVATRPPCVRSLTGFLRYLINGHCLSSWLIPSRCPSPRRERCLAARFAVPSESRTQPVYNARRVPDGYGLNLLKRCRLYAKRA